MDLIELIEHLKLLGLRTASSIQAESVRATVFRELSIIGTLDKLTKLGMIVTIWKYKP